MRQTDQLTLCLFSFKLTLPFNPS